MAVDAVAGQRAAQAVRPLRCRKRIDQQEAAAERAAPPSASSLSPTITVYSGMAPSRVNAVWKIAADGLTAPTSNDSTKSSTSSAAPIASNAGRTSNAILETTAVLMPDDEAPEHLCGIGVCGPGHRVDHPFISARRPVVGKSGFCATRAGTPHGAGAVRGRG